jgi:hypothetical protein
MRGTLLDPASVVYRDVTRQAKGLYRLKHEVALKRGLAYLSRCNSGWFCHISEAPNQNSEENNTNIPDSSPTSKGKPRCITQYFKLLYYAILYLYIISCIKSRSWNGTLDAWILGTYVLCPSPYQIDTLLIGPVEVGWFPVTRAI